jgi:hypothetical protein
MLPPSCKQSGFSLSFYFQFSIFFRACQEKYTKYKITDDKIMVNITMCNLFLSDFVEGSGNVSKIACAKPAVKPPPAAVPHGKQTAAKKKRYGRRRGRRRGKRAAQADETFDKPADL